MNLLVKKFGAVLLISTLFFSCEDPSEVGLSLNPDLQNLKIQFVDIPLKVVNVRFDSINTTNQGRLLVGNVDDPEFGSISATAFTEMVPEFSNPTIPDDAVFESLKLKLLVNYKYGTNPSANQKFSIQQLSERISKKITYHKENSLSLLPEVIGEFNLSVDSIISDTIVQVNISSFIGENFFNLAKDTIVFKTDSTFKKYFNGLAIVGNNANSAMIGINPESIETKMVLSYRTPTDTTELEFSFNAFKNSISTGVKYFNNIDIDDTGMPVAIINAFHKEFEPVNNKIYLQSGAGLFPRVKLDALRSYIRNNNVILNRAELVIEEITTYQDDLAPPLTLSYFNTDNTNDFINIINTFTPKAVLKLNTASNLNVNYIESGVVPFRGDLSIYLQSILTESSSTIDINEDFLLIPKDRYSSINRMSFNKDKVKIRLYYTTFDQ